MRKQLVRFVIDKKLDIENHLIEIGVYKSKLHSNLKKNDRIVRLLELTVPRQKKEIAKSIAGYYSVKNKMFLKGIAGDLNKAWLEIEKTVIRRFEMIHDRPFKFGQIRGVLSSANRFGYNIGEKWFATSMMRNKFMSIDTATHELMHFMFHKYYWDVCIERGLSQKQTWNIKEAFTVLLNLELSDVRFQPDWGYPEHKKIREAIEKSWKRYRDFNKALEVAIKSVR